MSKQSRAGRITLSRGLCVCVIALCWTLQGCLLFERVGGCQENENECVGGGQGDGLDNDCDGVIDEGCTCAFNGLSDGVCGNGVTAQDEQVCTLPRDYVEEEHGQCDGKDNDCDGITDEGCRCDIAGTSAAVCALGTILSNGECEPPALYALEETTCDGYDNDCDALRDEGCDYCEFMDVLLGVCARGVEPSVGGECEPPANYAVIEDDCAADPLAGDNADNDCDGVIDEGCACPFGDVFSGVCGWGRRTGNEGEDCMAPLDYMRDEKGSPCDGLDNDCDGFVDNGCVESEGSL